MYKRMQLHIDFLTLEHNKEAYRGEKEEADRTMSEGESHLPT